VELVVLAEYGRLVVLVVLVVVLEQLLMEEDWLA
jgi:hypothetical protein